MAIKLSFEEKINVSAKPGDLVYYTNTTLQGGYEVADLNNLVLIGPIQINGINRRSSLETSLTKNYDQGIQFDLGGYPWQSSGNVPQDTQDFSVTVGGVLIPEIDPGTGNANYTYNPVNSMLNFNILFNPDPVEIKLLYTILVDDSSFVPPVSPVLNDQSFIMFKKNEKINSNGLKGYYAEVKFENNSNEKAELFATSSEMKESSK